MRIYFDNNATTAIHPAVARRVAEALTESWGNPSSIHKEGQQARRALETAREAVAAFLHASPRDVVFTSGGSESNNAAIYGAAFPEGAGYGVVTSAVEHPSVLEPLRELENRGVEVVRVAPAPTGEVSAAKVIEAITESTRLVTVMLVNNETGVRQPVEEIAAECRRRGIHLHCDAVQAAGKIPLEPERLGADTVAITAHKFHGPKGIGALWIRRGTTLQRLIAGGAQERRRRAGTENVALASGFALAAELAREGLPEMHRVASLRDQIELAAMELGARVNGGGAPRVPTTANLCFPCVDGEGVVISMDLEGVALSTGSACASGRVEPSHVLIAMGLSEEDARSSVRISLSRFTSQADVEALIALLGRIVPRHRRAEAAGPVEGSVTSR